VRTTPTVSRELAGFVARFCQAETAFEIVDPETASFCRLIRFGRKFGSKVLGWSWLLATTRKNRQDLRRHGRRFTTATSMGPFPGGTVRDLGFFHAASCSFSDGCSRTLSIVRGVNRYPQDIRSGTVGSAPAYVVQAGSVAPFRDERERS